jgi:hypothetical protein
VIKAREAADDAKRRTTFVSIVSILAAVGVAIALLALMFQALSVIQDAHTNLDTRVRMLEESVRSIQTSPPPPVRAPVGPPAVKK